MGVHVAFQRLLLQDIRKLVLADAAEERAYLFGLLDHPLGGGSERQDLSDGLLMSQALGEWTEAVWLGH